jgi:hypothetical protein
MQKLPNLVPAFSHHLKPLDARWRPVHLRSTAPLNRSNSALIVAPPFASERDTSSF